MLLSRILPAALVALLVALTPPTRTTAVYVDRRLAAVIDGDTVDVSPQVAGVFAVRLLGIDTPEPPEPRGDGQEPWASRATESLRTLLPPGEPLVIRACATARDPTGRALGHIIRARDRLNVNREQIRLGHAVTFVIWPDVAHFADYRRAQIEAQDHGRGIWSAASPLRELPFEHRLRAQGQAPEKPVGDYFTRRYVAPADFARVHVNNRVFCWSEEDAHRARYPACPKVNGDHDPTCFASGR